MLADSVFISYSQKDAQEALELAKTLKERGGNIWIDCIDLANIGVSEDAEELTEKAILSSKFVILITSNNALNDSFVKDEKQFARDHGKEVVLAKIAACDTAKKMRWRRLPTVDLTQNRAEGLSNLLHKIGVEVPLEDNTNKQTPRVAVEKGSDAVISTPAPKEEIIQTVEAPKPNDALSLLEELRTDIDLYEATLNNQIKSSYMGMYLLIACSIALLLGLYLIPDLKALLDSGEENLKYLSPIGGMIPSSLSTFSWNKIKEKKKRLSSLKACDRKLSRMESGIIDYSKNDIIILEDEVLNYVNA